MGPEASESWPPTSGNLGRWTTGHPNAEKEHYDGDLSSCLGFLHKDGSVGGKNQRRPET